MLIDHAKFAGIESYAASELLNYRYSTWLRKASGPFSVLRDRSPTVATEEDSILGTVSIDPLTHSLTRTQVNNNPYKSTQVMRLLQENQQKQNYIYEAKKGTKDGTTELERYMASGTRSQEKYATEIKLYGKVVRKWPNQ